MAPPYPRRPRAFGWLSRIILPADVLAVRVDWKGLSMSDSTSRVLVLAAGLLLLGSGCATNLVVNRLRLELPRQEFAAIRLSECPEAPIQIAVDHNRPPKRGGRSDTRLSGIQFDRWEIKNVGLEVLVADLIAQEFDWVGCEIDVLGDRASDPDAPLLLAEVEEFWGNGGGFSLYRLKVSARIRWWLFPPWSADAIHIARLDAVAGATAISADTTPEAYQRLVDELGRVVASELRSSAFIEALARL